MKRITLLNSIVFLIFVCFLTISPALGIQISDIYDKHTGDANTITDLFLYPSTGGAKIKETYGEKTLAPYYFGGQAFVSPDHNFFDLVVEVQLDDGSSGEVWIQPFIYNANYLSSDRYNGFHFEIWDDSFLKRITTARFSSTSLGYVTDYHIFHDDLPASGTIGYSFVVETEVSKFGLRQVAVLTAGAVPEPATFMLFGFGLLGLTGMRRKK